MPNSKAKRRYGPKMANPRFTASKEHRLCGPLGHYTRHKNGEFTTKKGSNIKRVTVIRPRKRFQRSKEELYEYFGFDVPE